MFKMECIGFILGPNVTSFGEVYCTVSVFGTVHYRRFHCIMACAELSENFASISLNQCLFLFRAYSQGIQHFCDSSTRQR